MSSNIQGINFDNQIVTAKDHGRLYQCLITDGVLNGCTSSFSGTALNITPGYLLVAGRQMKLSSNVAVTVDGATSGYARVLLEIDLSEVATADTFQQAAFQVQYASSTAGFSGLTQDDINSSGTLYQFVFCVVSLGISGISGIVSTAAAATVRIPVITSEMLASSAVSSGKLASNAVTSGKIATGAVESAKLADGAVITVKLGDGSVTEEKLANLCVSTGKLQNAAVTTAKLADGAVTIAKGGTGSSNGSTGLKNLLAAGALVLSAHQYGTALPAAGTAGRLFFKKV